MYTFFYPLSILFRRLREKISRVADDAMLDGKSAKLFLALSELERGVLRANAHCQKKLLSIAEDTTLPENLRSAANDLLDYADPVGLIDTILNALNNRHPHSG